MSNVIVWADVETTGLTAHKDFLLEIAVLITDLDLNILDDTGYHAYVNHDRQFVYNKANPYVRDMHTTSGLWDKLKGGKHTWQIDTELLAYIKQFAPWQRTARLAGNSVRLDANFFDQWLPQTANHLHYRILDVSSLAFEADIRDIPLFPKAGTHEAMTDIRESIEELRYLRKELYR